MLYEVITPFKKHPLNPVINSGHEVCFFPFKEGVAGFAITDGNEHFTVQYAKDWVNFEIAGITEMMPLGGNGFVPDAFTDTKDGRGITWGLCFFRNSQDCCYLARFDCDLSLDVHDPEMKKNQYPINAEEYFKKGLSAKQRVITSYSIHYTKLYDMMRTMSGNHLTCKYH